MSHPLVDAEDALIADLLAGTVEVLREAGGFIAPTTRLVERRGQLSLESTGEDGSALVRIPRECFVRVDRVVWAEQDDRMIIIEIPEDFSDIETEMLYLQVALHNACDKLAWMRCTHPSLDPELSDELIEAVRELIPSFRNPPMAATDVLWANRCFRIALSPDSEPERVLIPLVDMLNHHERGAVADWTGEEFQVVTARPFGTQECALNYGMDRDALELAVVYGFTDSVSSALGTHYDPDALARLRSIAESADPSPAAHLLGQAAAALIGAGAV